MSTKGSLWTAYLRIADALERPSFIGGRVVILLCLLLYFGALARCIRVFQNQQMCWLCVGTPDPLSFPAGDLIVFPPAVRNMDEGVSPYDPSPYDPYISTKHGIRSFNYPRIWLILPRLGLTVMNVETWRLVICIVFFLAVLSLFGGLNWISGLVSAAAVCSPAVMFGVERCNTDLCVFTVLVLAVFCFNDKRSGFAGYGLLLFASILKLYPALTFVTVLRERTWKRRLSLLLGLTAIFAGYLYLIRNDLKMMFRVTPQMPFLSFGRKVLLLGLTQRPYFYALGVDNSMVDLGSLAVLVVSVAVACWAAFQIRATRAQSLQVGPEKQLSLMAFQIGATLFTCVFAVAISFDYRMVYLLLTIPQILNWARNRDLWGAISTTILVVILGAMWLIHGHWTQVLFDHVLTWILFVYLTTALLIILPASLSWPKPATRPEPADVRAVEAASRV